MTKIFLTDSDEEAIVDFVQDHGGTVYIMTNELFKNNERKDSLWKTFARRRKPVSRPGRHGSSLKEQAMASSHSPSFARPQRS